MYKVAYLRTTEAVLFFFIGIDITDCVKFFFKFYFIYVCGGNYGITHIQAFKRREVKDYG